jgi:hypothetical protein
MSFYDPPNKHPGVAELQTKEPPIVVVSTTPTVPVRLSLPRRWCRVAHIRGNKAATGDESADANTGDVFIGKGSVLGQQGIAIGPNGTYILENADLSDWYLRVGTANDGVVIQPQI